MSGGLAAEVSVPTAVAGVGIAGTGVAIAGSALSNMFDVRIQKSNKSKESTDSNKKPTSRNQMQKQVEKGQAPKEVDRVDGAHTEGQQPHVHFKDGTALNQDGTVHDAHKGTPNLTNGTRKWLEENGWKGNKKMKFYGYEKDNERLMKLSEATFDGTLEELEDLINFLKNVQEEHTKVVKKTDICHSHFRDWSDKWNKEDSDFIVVTRF